MLLSDRKSRFSLRLLRRGSCHVQSMRKNVEVSYQSVVVCSMSKGHRQILSREKIRRECGRPLDPCGHHRAACAQAGMLGRRGYTLESIMARICREAGGRVRDMDVQAPLAGDSRRLEAVVDGLPVRGGAQVAVDTTLVCVCTETVPLDGER